MYSQNVILNLWKQLAILTSTEELFPYNYTCLAYLNQLLLLAQTISCIYPWARALPVGEKSLKLTTAGWRNQPHLTTQPDWPQMPIQLKASSLMFIHFLPPVAAVGRSGPATQVKLSPPTAANNALSSLISINFSGELFRSQQKNSCKLLDLKK